MSAEDKVIILRVLENYALTGNASDEEVKVLNLPKGKTSYIEKTGQDGRTLMLDEYRIQTKVIRAGYSSRSGTVYFSLISG